MKTSRKTDARTLRKEAEKAAQLKALRESAHLSIYASGSGSHSFVWIIRENGRDVAAPFGVTMEDVRLHGTNLIRPGWRLLDRWGMPEAYQPVKRLGPDVLEMDGNRFKIGLDGFVLRVWHEGREVYNISMLAALRFYLNNEELILKQEEEETAGNPS